MNIPIGFNNIGNTCWLNSLLQCLLNLHHFTNLLDNTNFEENSLCNYISLLKNNTSTHNLLYKIMVKIQTYFNIGAPHDAQEAFLYFIDLMQNETCHKIEQTNQKQHMKDWYKFQKNTTSKIYDMFYTQFYFRTSDKEDRYEPFLSLPMFYIDNFHDSFLDFFDKKRITILAPIIAIHIINSKEVTKFELLDYFELIHKVEDDSDVKTNYFFSSCIFHIGNNYGGHYISIVRRNKKLFLCDDNNIIELKDVEIFNRLTPTLVFYTSI
jgi:ubiquitin C-terminal hydrolase